MSPFLLSSSFGFVTQKDFYKSTDFNKFANRLSAVESGDECVMHFRLATHGSVCNQNCHPFCCDGVYFAHNGILDITPVGNLTDSETAFRRVIMPVVRRYGYGSDEMREAVESVIGSSRFAFMHRGETLLFGDWTESGGCLYSNMRWQYLLRYSVNKQYINCLSFSNGKSIF